METPPPLWSLLAWCLLMELGNSYVELSKSSSHVSEKHVTLTENPKDDKNNLKFSEFILMLWIFKWRIENQSVTELSRNLYNLPGNKHIVSKFLKFSLSLDLDHMSYLVQYHYCHPANFILDIHNFEGYIQSYFVYLC